MNTNGRPAQYNSRVNFAAGVVSAQADCRIEQALALINERAEDEHVPVEEIADRIFLRCESGVPAKHGRHMLRNARPPQQRVFDVLGLTGLRHVDRTASI